MRTGGDGRVFLPDRQLRSRIEQARARWRGLGLVDPSPHECRHTYASYMIAAGVNAKAISTFMGHANIKITLDLYGHLMPGSEDQAAGLLDAYLARSAGDSTAAQTAAHPTEAAV